MSSQGNNSLSKIKNIPSNIGNKAKKVSNDNDKNNRYKENQAFLTKNTYSVAANKWYTAKPYGFKIKLRNSKKAITMFLPISPTNLTITTDFATNIITTLYGTVEEHSDVRYYDINIEGTTGMAPEFTDYGSGEPNEVFSSLRREGRSSAIKDKAIISQNIASGFFSKTINRINDIINKASDIIPSDKKTEPESAVTNEQSGYMAFHNLYRVLLQYKKDAAGVSAQNSRPMGQHPITFFNYKDGNEYDVVVRAFTMRRSVENPMLYYYSIQLRGYNLRSVGSSSADIKTTMDTNRLKDLGLDGVSSSSILDDIKKKANGVKSTIGSLMGGINTLGR